MQKLDASSFPVISSEFTRWNGYNSLHINSLSHVFSVIATNHIGERVFPNFSLIFSGACP